MHPENHYQTSDPYNENPNWPHWEDPGQYGGIGRLLFLVLSLMHNFLSGCLLFEMMNRESWDFYWVVVTGNFVAAVYLRISRLGNLGYHWSWMFGFLIPGLNFLVEFLCFAGPAGFARHRTLDDAGLKVAWITGALFVLLLIFVAGAVHDSSPAW